MEYRAIPLSDRQLIFHGFIVIFSRSIDRRLSLEIVVVVSCDEVNSADSNKLIVVCNTDSSGNLAAVCVEWV